MTDGPRIVGTLPGGIRQRDPYPGEGEFFRTRPDVSGMATEDGMVVLNPFSSLTERQRAAVALNEAARIFMEREGFLPEFGLTRAQESAFAGYGSVEAVRATVAARLLSGDRSSLTSKREQQAFVRRLARAMGLEL